MNKLLLVLSVLLWSSGFTQSEFQQFLNSVNSASTDSAKSAIIDSFLVEARQVGIPFIEDSTANFIYRGNISSVSLEIIDTISGTSTALQRLANTDFFYLSKTFEMDARLEYYFKVDGDTANIVLDPENPAVVIWLGFLTSELAMPGYEPPTETNFNPSIPHGTLMNHNIFSTELDTTYSIFVYLTPGYNSNPTQQYFTGYAQDGQQLLILGYLNIFDNLIDQQRIMESIFVFIPSFSNTRTATYAGERRFDYENFVVNTVVPFIDSNYRTKQNPQGRGIGGASFGANISALIAYRNPDLFGNCLMFSPALFPNNNEVPNLYQNGDKKDIKIYIDWGTYEPLITDLAIPFRDILQAKGYDHAWNEWHEGHSGGNWRAHFDNAVEFLIPAMPTGVEDGVPSLVNGFELLQNYPNPFNPATTIRYRLPERAQVILSVYNIAGQLIETLANEYKNPGDYTVVWNAGKVSSGAYFIKIQAGEFVSVRKAFLLK